MMFKNKIRAYREMREMSQSDLAKAIGCAKSTISMYEAGKREPTFEVMEAIADVLNASFYDLLGRDETCFVYGVSRPSFTKKIPRLGLIPCGEPEICEENIEGYDDLPEGIVADYTLKCQGDSMINAKIEDGDIVYIRQQETVENGDIAAVWHDGATTLKRFYRNGDVVTLMPENPKYAPIFLSGKALEDLRVLGKAVGFTRIFK